MSQNELKGFSTDEKTTYFSQKLLLEQFRTLISCKILFGNFQDYYNIGTLLGSGSFSQVYHIIQVFNEQNYALKKVKRTYKTTDDQLVLDTFSFIYQSLINNEITILHSLHHQSILTIHEVFKLEDDYLGIVTEYIQGQNLATLIDRQKVSFSCLCIQKKLQSKLNEKDIRLIISGILKGLEYLHQHNVIHRDLKPSNVMIVNSLDGKTIKIIDFGLSIQNEIKYNCCGTPGYMAPEIIQNKSKQSQWTTNSDIFSLGVIFYQLYYFAKDKHALTEKMKQNQFKTIKIVKLTFRKFQNLTRLLQLYENYIQLLKDLVKQMLQSDPSARISAQQALSHPFMKNSAELKLGNLDFQQQISCGQNWGFQFLDQPIQIAQLIQLNLSMLQTRRKSLVKYVSQDLQFRAELRMSENQFQFQAAQKVTSVKAHRRNLIKIQFSFKVLIINEYKKQNIMKIILSNSDQLS